MSDRRGVNYPDWQRGMPAPQRLYNDKTRKYRMGSVQEMAFVSRTRALHHWIRKGNENKAYLVARELFRQAAAILRRHQS